MKYMLANLGSSISTSRIAISDGAEAHGAAILQKFLLKRWVVSADLSPLGSIR